MLNLTDDLEKISGIGDKTKKYLNNAGLFTVEDLITHYPFRYNIYNHTRIEEAQLNDLVIISGTLQAPRLHKKGYQSMIFSSIKDVSGRISLSWFNQPYIIQKLKKDKTITLYGKISMYQNRLQLTNPRISSQFTNQIIEPIYPQTKSLKTNAISRYVNTALASLVTNDQYNDDFRHKYNLIDLEKAILQIHDPQSLDLLDKSIYRLSFDEMIDLHRKLSKEKPKKDQTKHKIQANPTKLQSFINSLPFKPTPSQSRSIKEIAYDLTSPYNANRLLQGDVGSGKTLIAVASSYLTHLSGLKTLIMAPTQILATQLYESFKSTLKDYDIKLELITSSTKPQSDYDILIGTQAILNIKSLDKVGLIIVDEEHKFGVNQRKKLNHLAGNTNKLSMTATPIPRTLALTSFNHLDISTLNKIPGRLEVKTYLTEESKRNDAYAWIDKQIKTKNYKVIFVAPLIEDSEFSATNNLKSSEELYKNLKSVYKGHKVALLHGKLKDNDKQKVISDFKNKDTNIIVSTTVIEVGIDIPDANVIVIDSADRFGLSQLHQLRGRVGRSNKQAYCILFTNSKNEKALERLEFFTKNTNGDKLASYDMLHRGPGEISGTAQHGFLNLKLADIFDEKLLETTKKAYEDLKKLDNFASQA